ncbi:MAG: hypothetical protein G01um10145_394 [Microgenomates group bacterium Gr01-1014_5]|nr:MAG: hypothetical protein G01um10145_394 [Microgenomates group bacterium Gr01-1014_5]
MVEHLPFKEGVVGSSPTGLTFCYIAGSSNGRTAAFEVAYLGSNPSPAANYKVICEETKEFLSKFFNPAARGNTLPKIQFSV